MLTAEDGEVSVGGRSVVMENAVIRGRARHPAIIGDDVRIHGVVQVNTILPPGATVPIGWVAVGNPAEIYPPGQHEQIWAIQESLDFPGTICVG